MAANHFPLCINEKAPFLGTAPNRRGLLFNGGAGIRTPVREKIDHSVYVRIPPIDVSSRWPVDGPLLNKPSQNSPTGGGRARQAIPNLRYSLTRLRRADRRAGAVTPKSYAASARLELAVVNRSEGFTRIQRPRHAATASLTPSKPVAPITEE